MPLLTQTQEQIYTMLRDLGFFTSFNFLGFLVAQIVFGFL